MDCDGLCTKNIFAFALPMCNNAVSPLHWRGLRLIAAVISRRSDL
jgi:hypothetical protein